MYLRRLLLFSVPLLIAGCTFPVRQRTDQTIRSIANQPIDIKPDDAAANVASKKVPAHGGNTTGVNAVATSPPVSVPNAPANRAIAQPVNKGAADVRQVAQSPAPLERATLGAPTTNELRYATQQPGGRGESELDARTGDWLGVRAADDASHSDNGRRPAEQRSAAVQTVSWSQLDEGDDDGKKYELDIPRRLPGSETPRVILPRGEAAREQAVEQIYPPLPPLPVEPRPLPGPDGRPYTLADLQRIAAANSPKLRQAAADVRQAWGKMLQSRTYANPTGSFFLDPNANNTSSGVNGLGIEQVIKTAGKQKLAAAAAYKDYENAELALRAARYELATQVRQAYFAILVDRETLVVTQALARFTDEIYRLQTGMVRAGSVAGYEPASLRAQAFTTRLAYQQAIATYIYDWKSLVALLGLEQLPLTEVAGEIGRFIPYYDYDQVLAYVLRNHTDILRARNLVPQSRYNLKLAQVTPIPDLDATYRYAKDFTAFPFGSYSQFMVGMSLPVWDRNKGNIIAAQASVVRATEEQHSAARDLTNRLADAYTNYQNNLYGIDYYRRYILPDLVRFYRGVYRRRLLEPGAIDVGDLAFAQQNVSQNVTLYLTQLGNLWQSAVAVADFLQTDDLFQMAAPRPLPELPDFQELSRWACGHAAVAASCGVGPGGRADGVFPPASAALQPANGNRSANADRPGGAPVRPAAVKPGRPTSAAIQRRKEDQ